MYMYGRNAMYTYTCVRYVYIYIYHAHIYIYCTYMHRFHVPEVFIYFRYFCVDVPYFARIFPLQLCYNVTYVDLQIRRVTRLHGICVYAYIYIHIRLCPNSKLPSTASTKIEHKLSTS